MEQPQVLTQQGVDQINGLFVENDRLEAENAQLAAENAQLRSALSEAQTGNSTLLNDINRLAGAFDQLSSMEPPTVDVQAIIAGVAAELATTTASKKNAPSKRATKAK
jgi:FtsZ-binding cell division protein ZapB